jgi:hypothetical protein
LAFDAVNLVPHGGRESDGRHTGLTILAGIDMDLEGFRATMSGDAPPAAPPALQALWRAARGEWAAAHELAQSLEDPVGAWVHAHLHRIEGDEDNAGYWYRRAGKPHSHQTLEAEWEEIAEALLARP